jgi:uncharacterized protein YndB with AHSA1/START domain
MIAFQTSIGIERSIEDVFAYVSEPANLPAWNSAVRSVQPTSAASNATGSTYAMERLLPTGAAMNKLEIIMSEPPHRFAIRATDGPTPFAYRYDFIAEDSGTILQVDAQVDLPGLAAVFSQLTKLAVKSGVDDNLATLKTILEGEKHPPASARR